MEVSLDIIGVIEAISMISRLNSRNPEPSRTTCHNFWLTSVRSRGAEFIFLVHSSHDCVVRIAASVRTQLLFCRSLSDRSIGGTLDFFASESRAKEDSLLLNVRSVRYWLFFVTRYRFFITRPFLNEL